MDKKERRFACTSCGASVTVEFGAYFGGPMAYEDYAKCASCGREFTDKDEIDKLVAIQRDLRRKKLEP